MSTQKIKEPHESQGISRVPQPELRAEAASRDRPRFHDGQAGPAASPSLPDAFGLSFAQSISCTAANLRA